MPAIDRPRPARGKGLGRWQVGLHSQCDDANDLRIVRKEEERE